jgi:phenylacetate-coenzyme A ligase PaaK-like adenylate-forming protein
LNTFKSFESKLYTVNDQSFTDIALELFHFQASNNPVYRDFIKNLSIDVQSVKNLEQIPFLPISFFKHTLLKSGTWNPEVIFTSSGTGSNGVSRHAVASMEFYLQHARRCFEYFFGSITEYHVLALLPSYLERQGSSLIAMIDHFIKSSLSTYSSFYLHDTDRLLVDIVKLQGDKQKVILWGVSFALLDLAEYYRLDLSKTMIVETGGMKGRRKEITRAELHNILGQALSVREIFSEYGMTELLSQAYTRGDDRFVCPPWMKVLVRELTDPLEKGIRSQTGGINVIDLANIHSIAFIETEDLGKVYDDGTFEVLGRMDNSDIRGCNLLVE